MFAARNAFMAGSKVLAPGSVLFDGAGDYLTISGVPTIGNQNFTIEYWAKFTLGNTYPTLFDFHASSDTAVSAPAQILTWDLFRKLSYYIGGAVNSSRSVTGATTINDGTWYHLAVCRSGSSLRMFVNGSQDGSTMTDTANYTTTTICIGASPYYSLSDNFSFTGNISNFRLITGTALYTTAFTPSSAELTAVPGTALLTCQHSNDISDASTNRLTVTANGNVSGSSIRPFT